MRVLLFALSVLFDPDDLVRTNRATIGAAVAINSVLGVVCIVITFLVTQRIALSLRSFSRRLAPWSSNSSAPDTGPRSELAELETALAAREQIEAERGALLGRVAAVIAHEVRNPLANILNALSTIRRLGVESRRGKGTTISVVLPLAQPMGATHTA